MCLLQVCGLNGLSQRPKYKVRFSIKDNQAKHRPGVRSSFLLACVRRTEGRRELQFENQVSLLRIGNNIVMIPSLQIRVELVVSAILSPGKWMRKQSAVCSRVRNENPFCSENCRRHWGNYRRWNMLRACCSDREKRKDWNANGYKSRNPQHEHVSLPGEGSDSVSSSVLRDA